MPNVLVLDANQRSALAVVRSLGRHGLTVITADHALHSLGSVSRFSVASLIYPNPATDPEAFTESINEAIERRNVTAVVPATDLTTMLLVSQSNPLKNARLVAPERESYETLTDKALLIDLAGRLGIRIPDTRVATTSEAIVAASRELGFPLVLKPARSRYMAHGCVYSTAVEIVKAEAHLSETISRCTWLNDIPCLVQEFIHGYGAGIFTLYATSNAIAWFAHRRLREKPPGGGVSVLSESVPVDPNLRATADRLLSAVRWSGVAMVEFRIGEDGTPYLMEVNGRFWGSLQLSIDCGVDFPWLAYQLAMNERPDTLADYAIGRRLRWLLGDLDRLIIELKQRPRNAGEYFSSVVTFLRTFLDPSCRQEVLRRSDPGPGVREVVHWLRGL